MSGVRSECEPPIRRVTLDTGRMNVLDLAAVRALRAAVAASDAETRVVLLAGRADAFCAGLDLATLAGGDEARLELLVEMGALLLELYGGPTRLVVACRGHAVAAGAMLLLVADARVGAAGSYKVGFSEPSRGMPLPALPVELARERLDRRHFQASTLLGRLYDPEGAVETGFFDEVVPAERLEAVARERAASLAALASNAYTGTLDAVRGEALRRMRRLLDEERVRLDALRSARAKP